MPHSLSEPTRWRNHSRATKIGQRTWNLKALCSKGVPCLSRMRKRMSPASESSISCLWRAKLTRAPLTTERSEAIASSRRTKPWSRTGMLFSGITSAAVDTEPSVPGLYVGTSGWSYPSWRPDFYPAGTKPADFLASYAERFTSVELNASAYQLPSEENFRTWASQVPQSFRFAVRMPRQITHGSRVGLVGTFCEGAGVLGEKLGPMLVVLDRQRDDGILMLLRESIGPELEVAFDFRHDSW